MLPNVLGQDMCHFWGTALKNFLMNFNESKTYSLTISPHHATY